MLGDSTELVVASRPAIRGEVSVPLAGIEVYAKNPPAPPTAGQTAEQRQEAERQNPPRLLGITDWRGRLTLSSDTPQLQLMYIRNGGLLLARLPMLIGLDSELRAEIPDDNPRLQAEGFVKGMNGEITDLVVQRNLLQIRFRRRIEEGKLDEAQKLLEEFRGLKSMNELQRMLDQQMLRQKPTSHPGVKQRIDTLYADEREMIARFVDVEMLNRMTRDLDEARRKPPRPAGQPADAPARSQDESEKKKLPAALQKAASRPRPARS
jgi:hypothetical protein